MSKEFKLFEEKKDEEVKIFDPSEYANELVFDKVDDEIINKVMQAEEDLPIPPNFVEFCLGRKFLNTTVLPRQIQIASEFFGEICHFCSNPDAIDNLYDQDMNWIYNNVVFLRHGRCPKCKRTKIDMMQEGKWEYKNALYVVAGQRCVTGDTIVYTDNGLKRIADYSNNIKGYSTCNAVLYNGKNFVKSNLFYEGYPEVVYRIIGKYGTEIAGTNDHPVITLVKDKLKFKRLGSMTPGRYILVKYGQNIWANSPCIIDVKSFESSFRKRFGYNDDVILPSIVDRNLCEWLGWFVSEGHTHVSMRYVSLSGNSHKYLIDLTKKVFKGVKIKVYDKDVRIISEKVAHFLAYLGVGFRSTGVRVPDCVLNNTKKNVCAFLSSYFEGDGGTEKRDITCYSISRSLIKDIRVLLLNLGIFSTIREGKTWATNGSKNQVSKDKFMLTIMSDNHIKLFKKNINFISNRKKSRLNKIIYWYENKKVKNNPFLCNMLCGLNTYFANTYNMFERECIKYFGERPENRKSAIAEILGSSLRKYVSRICDGEFSLSRGNLIWFLDCIDEHPEVNFSKPLLKRLKFLSKFRDENILLEEVDRIEYGYETTYDFYIPEKHRFLSNSVISHNSGKSILTSLIAHYQNARFLTMRDKKKRRVIPYRYFKNPPAPLYGTFTAVTYDQAIKNLWEPFKGYIESPWYQEYHEILDYFSKKDGIQLYKSSQTFLQYNHKRIAWLPETPSKKGLRGKTRIFFSIDELSWYDLNNKDDSIKGSAKEVMAAGRNSLLTVRKKSLNKLKIGNYNIPTGMECYVSSPAESNDILMRKVRESKRNPTMLGYRYATWHFNPEYKSPKDIDEPDQMILMRDFGANPPLGNSQYYSDGKTLIENVDNDRKPCALFRTQVSKNSFGDTTLFPELDCIKHTSTYPKILSIDNGLSGNCFAASLNHLEGNKVCNDFLVIVQPDEKHKVNLSKCFDDFVMGLLKDKRFNIAMVAYDRWNSEQAISKLRDDGFRAEKYSITYSDFLTIRDSFSIHSFGFIKPETDTSVLINYEGDFDIVAATYKDPYFALLAQILLVRDMGKFLAKPGNGCDDDVFRAWSLGATLLMKEEYKNIFTGEGKVNKQSERALGCMTSFSHRGAGVSASVGIVGKHSPHRF